jgi:hypothetical protein
MKTATVLTEFEARAADALRTLLARFSAIKLIELKHESQRAGGAAAILARIEIYGHSHTLACEADSKVEPARLRAVLREKQAFAAPLAADTIPVLIAPYLSPEAQELCKQNNVGFLDFVGNARLTIADFFIVMRALPREGATRVSATPQKLSAHIAVDPIFPDALPKISRKHPAIALSA